MSGTEADDLLDDLEDAATPAPAWPASTFELILRKPVTFKDVTFTELQLREPTCGEWEEIFAQPVLQRRRFAIHKIAAIPMGAAALLGIGDAVIAENYLNAFFETGQTIAVE